MKALETTRINPTGEFPGPVLVTEAAAPMAKIDCYTDTETDRSDMEQQWPQLKGQFLIDCYGIVRWASIECAAGKLGAVPGKRTPDEADDHGTCCGRCRGG